MNGIYQEVSYIQGHRFNLISNPGALDLKQNEPDWDNFDDIDFPMPPLLTKTLSIEPIMPF